MGLVTCDEWRVVIGGGKFSTESVKHAAEFLEEIYGSGAFL